MYDDKRVHLINALVSAFFTDSVTHPHPGEGTVTWKYLFQELLQHSNSGAHLSVQNDSAGEDQGLGHHWGQEQI